MNLSPQPRPLSGAFSSIILIVVLAPHAARLPAILILFTCALVLWRYLLDRTHRSLPPSIVRLALLVVAILIVYANFGTLLGRDSGIAFLVALAGLKLLEMTAQRDLFTISLLNYFLVITQFLYTQSLFTVAYMAIAVLLITTSLINMFRQTKPASPVVNARLAGILLLQATPIAIVLFLFFPRLSGPLWNLPPDAFSSRTGLSDTMEPGRISKLVRSNDIAFRVYFENDLPNPAFRYWRGPILWNTDGKIWTGNENSGPRFSSSQDLVQFVRTLVSYRVTLEPHNKRWLFALDIPAVAPSQSYMTSDFQLRTNFDVNERISYKATSFIFYKTNVLSAEDYQLASAFPVGTNPRLQTLGKNWRRQLKHDHIIVAEALKYYQQKEFVYTLNPPSLDSDPMDQFLFETRKGFCEHFAASFTLLMRAAGIPARVVTGYQGGELNPVGQYLVVRQRDAHAWAEVWLKSEGWVRIDPTAAVAPQRVEFGIDTSFDELGVPTRFNQIDNNILSSVLKRATFVWDAVNSTWNQWILTYDKNKQQKFFSFLHLERFNWNIIALLLIVMIGILLGLIALIALRDTTTKGDPVEKEWRKVCRKLEMAGLKRHDWEGPQDYLARVTQTRPELMNNLAQIVQEYITLRFQKNPDMKLWPDFCQHVKNFQA